MLPGMDDGRDASLNVGRPAPLGETAPWAFALNETAASHDVQITLLSYAVVGDIVRVSGLVRVPNSRDVRLSAVPDLVITPLDGPALMLVAAHVLPQGKITWVSWVYERPRHVLVRYEARIEEASLLYRVGGHFQEKPQGPWVFRFRLPPPSDPVPAGSPRPD
jgi:hypothetical protein